MDLFLGIDFGTTGVRTSVIDQNKEEIIKDLQSCLATDEEIKIGKWKKGYVDRWPVERIN